MFSVRKATAFTALLRPTDARTERLPRVGLAAKALDALILR